MIGRKFSGLKNDVLIKASIYYANIYIMRLLLVGLLSANAYAASLCSDDFFRLQNGVCVVREGTTCKTALCDNGYFFSEGQCTECPNGYSCPWGIGDTKTQCTGESCQNGQQTKTCERLSFKTDCSCAGIGATFDIGKYCYASVSSSVVCYSANTLVGTCTESTGISPNQLSCQCGTASCTAATGFYCDATYNRCSTVPSCTQLDGKATTNQTCWCGAVQCSSGEYCDGANNRCSNSPTCINTDATSRNDKTCTCGTSTCEPNQTCHALSNTCKDSVYCSGDSRPGCEYVSSYSIVVSDNCQQNGYRDIGNATACSSAMKMLYGQRKNVSLNMYLGNQIAPGCSLTSAYFQAADVLFNTHANSSGLCGSEHSSKHCVCVVDAPVCDKTSKTNRACICGENVCSIGHYCYEPASVCSLDEPVLCPHDTGQSVNSIECRCGHATCKPGQYCDASASQCSSTKRCTYTNGLTRNNHLSCTCGNSACRAYQYCNYKYNTCCDTAEECQEKPSEMYGFVTMGQGCTTKCVKWRGVLRRGFTEQYAPPNFVQELDSDIICRFLRETSAVLPSQFCE